MRDAFVSLLAMISAGALGLGCAEEAPPRMVRTSTGVLVTPPRELEKPAQRCAYAVRRVAAEQFDCQPGELDIHPVGPRTFITSGCDNLGTFLCDDDPGAPPRVARQR